MLDSHHPAAAGAAPVSLHSKASMYQPEQRTALQIPVVHLHPAAKFDTELTHSDVHISQSAQPSTAYAAAISVGRMPNEGANESA